MIVDVHYHMIPVMPEEMIGGNAASLLGLG